MKVHIRLCIFWSCNELLNTTIYCNVAVSYFTEPLLPRWYEEACTDEVRLFCITFLMMQHSDNSEFFFLCAGYLVFSIEWTCFVLCKTYIQIIYIYIYICIWENLSTFWFWFLTANLINNIFAWRTQQNKSATVCEVRKVSKLNVLAHVSWTDNGIFWGNSFSEAWKKHRLDF